MNYVKHSRRANDKSEGVSLSTADIGLANIAAGKYVTVFYEDGSIMTGKTNRGGSTLYFNLKNYLFLPPQFGTSKMLGIKSVSVLRKRG